MFLKYAICRLYLNLHLGYWSKLY